MLYSSHLANPLPLLVNVVYGCLISKSRVIMKVANDLWNKILNSRSIRTSDETLFMIDFRSKNKSHKRMMDLFGMFWCYHQSTIFLMYRVTQVKPVFFFWTNLTMQNINFEMSNRIYFLKLFSVQNEKAGLTLVTL